MQEYQKRVVDERDELELKAGKLMGFMATGAFKTLDVDEQVRMKLQLKFMTAYWEVLNERIRAFKKDGVK